MKLSSKYTIKLLLFGLIYYIVSMLSLWFEWKQAPLPFWPAAGVAAGFTFIWGFRYLPAILIGTTAIALSSHTPLPITISNTIAQIGETIILIYLLRRFANPNDYFTHPKSLLWFLIAIIPAVLFSGLIQLFNFIVTSTPLDQTAILSVINLIVAKAMGILVMMPFIMIWKRPFPTPHSTKIKNESFVVAILSITLLLSTIFVLNQSAIWFIPLFFPLSLLIWAILRFHFHGATATSLFVAILVTITAVQENINPLNPSNLNGWVMQTSLIAVIAITGLLATIILEEREAVQSAFLKSQKQMQEQLLFSQTVMNALGEGIFVVDLNNRLEYINPVYAKTVGYTVEELIGKSPREFIAAAYEYKYDEVMEQRRQGVTSSYESALQHKNGRITPVLVTGAPRWENGRVTGAIVINTNLTERNRAQEIFELVVSKSPNTTIIINQKGNIIFANALVDKMFGYKPEDIVGKSFRIFLPDRFKNTHRQQEKTYHNNPFSRALGAGRVLQAVHADGRELSVEIALNSIEMGGESMVLTTIVDISPRVEMEQKLRRREAYLRVLVEQAPIGIIVADMNGIVTDANPHSINLLGSPSREKTVGLNLLTLPSLVKAGLSDAFRTVINNGNMVEKETWYTSIWGKRIYFLIRIVPHRNENDEQIGIMMLIEDMTARIQAEDAMLHLQKTESLGILAGGIAHDFNNLLVAIMAQSSLALLKMDKDSSARMNVEKSNNAAKRAATLTSQLLAYSGRGRFQIGMLNINTLIEENLELFTATIPKDIKLTQNLAPDLPPIEADIPQIQQVIMNLIINAAEAIGAESGHIYLTTAIKVVGNNDSQYGEYVTGLVADGHYIQLEIQDSGSGINEETMKKIFDPFFSTKKTGHGLGLAAVLGIIKGHKGALAVQSSENGTIFRLLFPVAKAKNSIQDNSVKAAAATETSQPVSGMVLVIDDEDSVIMTVTDILSLSNIKTMPARNGRDGVALYEQNQADIALVLLDFSMPGWDGRQTLHKLRAINPDVRVILSSGYSYNEEGSVQQFGMELPTAFLSKPYNATELLDTIMQYLPSAPNAGRNNK